MKAILNGVWEREVNHAGSMFTALHIMLTESKFLLFSKLSQPGQKFIIPVTLE